MNTRLSVLLALGLLYTGVVLAADEGERHPAGTGPSPTTSAGRTLVDVPDWPTVFELDKGEAYRLKRTQRGTAVERVITLTGVREDWEPDYWTENRDRRTLRQAEVTVDVSGVAATSLLRPYPLIAESYFRAYPDALLAVAGGYHFAVPGGKVELAVPLHVGLRPGSYGLQGLDENGMSPTASGQAATANLPAFPHAAGLPVFHHKGVALDYQNLKYNPCNDIIIPSVIRTDDLQKPLGRFYMYYAPHNAPGGICLAYADSPEGPWKEYDANPLIHRDWQPHYKVSHVSGPHAIWIAEEKKLFVYYHGENDVTRFASTTDGIHFHYEGVAFTTKLFHDVSEASYARMFRYTIPGKDNRYIALLMGNNRGTRRIYLAWSKDGRSWEPRQTPLVDPPPGTAQVAQAWYFPWQGKHYLIYHAHLSTNNLIADLHVSEVDAALEHAKYLGLFYDHASASPNNVAQMSPCFLTHNNLIYMYTNIGPRLNQKIALAVAESKPSGHQRQPAPSDKRQPANPEPQP
jgi:hypothetical protein